MKTFTNYFEAVKYKRELVNQGHNAVIHGSYDWDNQIIIYTVKEEN